MNLLQIVQAFCKRTGLPSPTYAAAATDNQIIQVVALLNEVCEDLCDRVSWQDLVKEATFTTVNGENQGAISTLAPSGFLRVIQETIYNRTLRLPLFGPIQPNQWQALKALPNPGPFYKYRIRGGSLMFNPAGVAGQTCAFEYASSWCVQPATGVAQASFTADADEFLLDYKLLLAGLRWKWKSEKGLAYAEEFRRYEELVLNASGRDATKPRISMDGGDQDFLPGIFVPAGSWNLS